MSNNKDPKYESDDDDIIAIQEHQDHPYTLAVEMEESQGLLSPSQNPRPQRRRRRRPQQQQQRLAWQQKNETNAVSQVDRHTTTDATHNFSAGYQSQSNAFESLESLLEGQQLSLSLTQESQRNSQKFPPANQIEGNDHTGQPQAMEVEEDIEKMNLPPNQSEEQHFDNKNLGQIQGTNDAVGIAAAETETAPDCHMHASNCAEIEKTLEKLETGQEHSCNGLMEASEGNTSFFSRQYDFYDDEGDNSLGQELKRRRKSLTGDKKKKKGESRIVEDPVQPTHSLRQRIQKERHSRSSKHKRDRSARSTSPRRPEKHQHPYKRDRSTRSVSPRPSRSRSPRNRRNVTSSPKQPVPVEKVNNSLVGYRPSHWGQRQGRKPARGPLTQLDVSSASPNRSRHQKRQQRKQLAAACSTSNMLRNKSPRRRATSGGGLDLLTRTPVTSNTSFRPDFLPTEPNVNSPAPQMDAMQIDSYEDDHNESNNNNNNGTGTNVAATTETSFLATARANARHTRRSLGEATSNNKALSNLLQQVKSESRTDGTRLRSGEYPFPNKVTSRFDLYDPRNRATSYMDVTLIGESCVPCASNSNGPGRSNGRAAASNNLSILGYIHTHHHYPDRAGGLEPFLLTANKCLAWICFSEDTLHEHNLQFQNSPQGYQLRIYNAVVFPCTSCISGPATMEEACRFTVVCTQLCEAYPSEILGQLQPSLSELLLPLAALPNAG